MFKFSLLSLATVWVEAIELGVNLESEIQALLEAEQDKEFKDSEEPCVFP